MKERRRSIGTAQLKMRELNIIIADSAGTPEVLGFDRLLVSSISDDGVGLCTINLRKAFNRACQIKGIVALEADVTAHVVSVSTSAIQIQITDLAGVAKDGDIGLCIVGSDARYDVA